MHSKSGVSVFPSPVELLHSSPAGLQKPNTLGLLLLMLDLQAGEPDVGLITLLWQNFCDIIIFQYSPVCGSTTWEVWDLIIL